MHVATDLFLALTPEKVLAAVEAGGLSCRPVCYPLNSFENRVYEVELEDRSRIVAKFYRPERWSEAQILAEHAFLAELAAEEIEVCTVMPFPDGTTLKKIDNIFYSLSERRGGRAPDELSDGDVSRLGMLVARMHNVGARRPAAPRPRLDAERYVYRTLDFFAQNETLPEPFRRRYVETAEAIAEIADDLMQGVATHRIHADLHLGNVLVRDEVLRVLDFDDFVDGPPVQDFWLALPGRDPETERQRELFLGAYEQLREFDRSTLRLIEPLRGLRMVRYAGWLARRWHDPAFKTAWSHFGSDEYWRQETEDLEEQLAVVRGERAAAEAGSTASVAAPSAAPVELTNKDYFWDWDGD